MKSSLLEKKQGNTVDLTKCYEILNLTVQLTVKQLNLTVNSIYSMNGSRNI